LVSKAFPNRPVTGTAIAFSDLQGYDWAKQAIGWAGQHGFMGGVGGGKFDPGRKIPRVQILVALMNGLGKSFASGGDPKTILQGVYRDVQMIPDYGIRQVALGVTDKIIVDQITNTISFSPDRPATRAEVAGMIYQALVSAGNLPALSPGDPGIDNIVGSSSPGTPVAAAPDYVGNWSSGRGDQLTITNTSVQFNNDPVLAYKVVPIKGISSSDEYELEITTPGTHNFLTKILRINVNGTDRKSMKLSLYDSSDDADKGQNEQGSGNWFK